MEKNLYCSLFECMTFVIFLLLPHNSYFLQLGCFSFLFSKSTRLCNFYLAPLFCEFWLEEFSALCALKPNIFRPNSFCLSTYVPSRQICPRHTRPKKLKNTLSPFGFNSWGFFLGLKMTKRLWNYQVLFRGKIGLKEHFEHFWASVPVEDY